jgi:hypothetical protein
MVFKTMGKKPVNGFHSETVNWKKHDTVNVFHSEMVTVNVFYSERVNGENKTWFSKPREASK